MSVWDLSLASHREAKEAAVSLVRRRSAELATDAATVVYQAVRQRLMILRDIITSGEELAPLPAAERFDDRAMDFYQERIAK